MMLMQSCAMVPGFRRRKLDMLHSGGWHLKHDSSALPGAREDGAMAELPSKNRVDAASV